ncbi:MAG: hypothetical protein V2I67_10035 [Thermoanaerobaculales bacterium]|jgi:hypothetical protein|nr:hypothetical protein [Thermoanaerobaculales bacterium]
MNDSQRDCNHNGAFGGALGASLLTFFAVKLGWGLLVPTLFAGAVAAGTVSASLSWSGAALIAAVVGVAVFAVRHPRRHSHAERHLAEGSSGA